MRIESSGGSTFNIDTLSADTPVSGDFFPFYDISGLDTNKVTLTNLKTAMGITSITDPRLAIIKTDGTGTHATIVAANADAAVSAIFLMPSGTGDFHDVDNTAGFITLTKSIYSFGGKNRATISRDDPTQVCFRVTTNTVQIVGVGFNGGGTGDPFFLEIQAPTVFSQAVYSDITLPASINGILVRSGNGVTLQNIAGYTMNSAIQVGDVSTVTAPVVVIRNCNLASYVSSAIYIYQCNRVDIVASTIVSGSSPSSVAVSIGSTCTGSINTTACIFDSSYACTIMDGTGTYISSADTFQNYTTAAVSSSASSGGTVIMNGSTLRYNPVDPSYDFTLDATTILKGYYFDAYIGELINVADSRSYRDVPNLRWAFMFGGNT